MKKLSRILSATLAAAMCLTATACNGGTQPSGEHVHDWGEWSVTTEPDCTHAGSRTRVCKTDPTHTDTETLPELGHDIIKHARTEPDCTHDGSEAYEECSRCDYVTPHNILPATGHNYVDGVCSCGAEFSSEGLLFTPSPDGTEWYVAGLGDCDDEDLVIPSSYKDKPVTAIMPYAFYIEEEEMGEYITSVSIPSTVKTIGAAAFYKCDVLEKVVLTDGLTEIGDQAFYECLLLSDITIPSTVTTIGTGAFFNNKQLKAIDIPDNVTQIGGAVFTGCSQLAEVSLGDGVKRLDQAGGQGFFQKCTALKTVDLNKVEYIGNACFMDCAALESIDVPATVTEIGYAAFTRLERLKTITLPDELQKIGQYAFYECGYFKEGGNWDDQGLLYIGKHLISANHVDMNILADPAAADVKIKDGITTIADFAFADAIIADENGNTETTGVSVKTVQFPSTLKYIGNGAFYKCAALTSINVPDNVTGLGGAVFYGCSALDNVKIGSGITRFEDYAETAMVEGGDGSVDELKTYYGMFHNCTSLKDIEFSQNFEYIGQCTFFGCTGLASLTVPDSVTFFAGNAVAGCSDLQHLYLGAGVEKFGDGENNRLSLNLCDKLTEIEVSSQNKNFMSEKGILYNKQQTVLCAVPKGIEGDIELPAGLTEISDYAFYECKNVTSIVIGDNVNKVGEYAFSGCAALTSATLGSALTQISDYMFENCNKLASVTIKGQITRIGTYAFYMKMPDSKAGVPAPALAEISLPASLKEIGNRAFYRCTSLKTIRFGGSKADWESIQKGLPYMDDTSRSNGEEITEGYWNWTYNDSKYYNMRMAMTIVCNDQNIDITSVQLVEDVQKSTADYTYYNLG